MTPTGDRADAGARPTAPAGGRSVWAVLGVGLALVAVVGLLALLGLKLAAVEGWFRGDETVVKGATPGVFSNGQLVRTAFRRAPDFTLRLFSGEELRLADLRGKPVFVNFWASWCPPCRDEAPLLERTWRDYREKGVVFVGVDVWDAEADARRFLREFEITYPNGPDPRGEISIDYGLAGIPESFFVDRQGQVARKWIGPFTDKALRGFLDELVGPGG